jgi:hypothetical protein
MIIAFYLDIYVCPGNQGYDYVQNIVQNIVTGTGHSSPVTYWILCGCLYFNWIHTLQKCYQVSANLNYHDLVEIVTPLFCICMSNNSTLRFMGDSYTVPKVG